MTGKGADADALLVVHRLLALGAHAADNGDGNGYAALFALDGVIRGLPSGPIEGREAIRAFYSQRTVGDPPRRHHVSSIYARFDDDGALRSTSCFMISGHELVFGVYEHEFIREEDAWLIQVKTTRIESRRTTP